MTQIEQCEFCRKPFNSTGRKVCPMCLNEMDEQLNIIRDYLYDHSGDMTLKKLAEATNIPEKNILYMMNEGRLITDNRINVGISCNICGREINKGAICEECAVSLAKDLSADERTKDKRNVSKPSKPDSDHKLMRVPRHK